MSLRPPLIILCLLPALANASNEYSCPLIGNYVVIRRDTRAMCYLAEVYNAQNSFGGHEILAHVEEIAVAGTLITGKANNQYFLLNTAQPDAAPEIFATAEQWNSALKANGVTPPVQLSAPDSLAANMPDHVLRPWEFRIMRNLFGLSDDDWAGAVILAGLILSFIIGLLIVGAIVRTPLVLILGIVINIVAQIVITGGGASALVGFFITPLVFVLVAKFGSMLRKLITRWLSTPVEISA